MIFFIALVTLFLLTEAQNTFTNGKQFSIENNELKSDETPNQFSPKYNTTSPTSLVGNETKDISENVGETIKETESPVTKTTKKKTKRKKIGSKKKTDTETSVGSKSTVTRRKRVTRKKTVRKRKMSLKNDTIPSINGTVTRKKRVTRKKTLSKIKTMSSNNDTIPSITSNVTRKKRVTRKKTVSKRKTKSLKNDTIPSSKNTVTRKKRVTRKRRTRTSKSITAASKTSVPSRENIATTQKSDYSQSTIAVTEDFGRIEDEHIKFGITNFTNLHELRADIHGLINFKSGRRRDKMQQLRVLEWLQLNNHYNLLNSTTEDYWINEFRKISYRKRRDRYDRMNKLRNLSNTTTYKVTAHYNRSRSNTGIKKFTNQKKLRAKIKWLRSIAESRKDKLRHLRDLEWQQLNNNFQLVNGKSENYWKNEFRKTANINRRDKNDRMKKKSNLSNTTNDSKSSTYNRSQSNTYNVSGV